MRYLEQGKTITNSWAKGAKGLSGATSYSYGSRLVWDIRQQQLRLSGQASASTELQSYLYANNKPLAEARGTQQVVAATISRSVGVELGVINQADSSSAFSNST